MKAWECAMEDSIIIIIFHILTDQIEDCYINFIKFCSLTAMVSSHTSVIFCLYIYIYIYIYIYNIYTVCIYVSVIFVCCFFFCVLIAFYSFCVN